MTFEYKEVFEEYTKKEQRNIKNWVFFSFSLCFFLFSIKIFLVSPNERAYNSPLFFIVCFLFIFYLSLYKPYLVNKYVRSRIKKIDFESERLHIVCCEGNVFKRHDFYADYPDIQLIKGLLIKKNINKPKFKYYLKSGESHELDGYTISSKNNNFPNILLIPSFFEGGDKLLEKLTAINQENNETTFKAVY